MAKKIWFKTGGELLLVAAGAAGLLWLGYSRLQPDLNLFYFALKKLELAPLLLFMPAVSANLEEQLHNARHYSLQDMLRIVPFYSRLAYFLYLPLVLGLLWKIRSIKLYRNGHGMDSLLKETCRMAACVIPVVERDIGREAPNVGPWRLLDTPLLFAMRHELLVEEPAPALADKGEALKKEEMVFFQLPKVYRGAGESFSSPRFARACLVPWDKSPYLGKKNLFRADHAAECFITQLGDLIKGEDFLSALVNRSLAGWGNPWLAVFAGILYRFGASRHDKESYAYPMLDHMSSLCAGKQAISGQMFASLTMETVQTLWQGYESHPTFLADLGSYATFTNSFMAHLAAWAKKKGKLSPTDYIWLRPMDRTLFLTLDQVGAQTAHVEALGVWSHVEAERLARCGLRYPYVKDAVEGLYFTLSTERWLPRQDIRFQQERLIKAWGARSRQHDTARILEEVRRQGGAALLPIIQPLPVRFRAAVRPFLKTELKLAHENQVARTREFALLEKAGQRCLANLRRAGPGPGVCPWCGRAFATPKQEGVAPQCLVDFTFRMDADRGYWRVGGVQVVCNMCRLKRSFYDLAPSSPEYGPALTHLEHLTGLGRDRIVDFARSIGELAVLYTSLSWEYEPASSLVLDLQALAGESPAAGQSAAGPPGRRSLFLPRKR